MKLNDEIHNYYEQLVLERLEALDLKNTKSEEYIADLICLVLNQLPPRYIRHDVDMAFYLPASERQQMEMKTFEAVKQSMNYLDTHK